MYRVGSGFKKSYLSGVFFLCYHPFHNSLPNSSSRVHWISVGNCETACT